MSNIQDNSAILLIAKRNSGKKLACEGSTLSQIRFSFFWLFHRQKD